MIYNLVIAGTLILAFFMCISAYCLGHKHGKQVANGITPTVEINPVKKAVEAVQEHNAKKEEEKLDDELTEMMSVTKESMLNAVKKER